MKERREQILAMSYGTRSLGILLKEKKLRQCRLLGENETTDDDYHPKYGKWTEVPAPLAKTPPPRIESDTCPSPSQKARPIEKEGTEYCQGCDWSPILLQTEPNMLISFEKNPDFNFLTLANVDLIVHRNDSWLRSYNIMYSVNESLEWVGYQYGTNDYRDFSNICPTIERPARSVLLELIPEPSLIPILPS